MGGARKTAPTIGWWQTVGTRIGAWTDSSRSSVVAISVASRPWARPTQGCPQFLPRWWYDSLMIRFCLAFFLSQRVSHMQLEQSFAELVLACRRVCAWLFVLGDEHRSRLFDRDRQVQ